MRRLKTGSDLICWLYYVYMHRKQQRTLHKITKQLEREVRHRAWLEKNLRQSQQVRDSRKRVLMLYTEAAEFGLREAKI